uniref:Uncharacterized protein n=1 Tax=Arundo donax TaxID=35708 RepID=A0A0A8ZAK3_ARUDO
MVLNRRDRDYLPSLTIEHAPQLGLGFCSGRISSSANLRLACSDFSSEPTRKSQEIGTTTQKNQAGQN